MLTNALPKLVNLRNVHISSGAEGLPPVLRILQSTNPRLRGLSLQYVIHLRSGPKHKRFANAPWGYLGHLTIPPTFRSLISATSHTWRFRVHQSSHRPTALHKPMPLYKMWSRQTAPHCAQLTSSLLLGRSQHILFPFETLPESILLEHSRPVNSALHPARCRRRHQAHTSRRK